MKIAIVHDFLKEYGGAERVLEVLHEIYPEAPIYTAFVDYKGLGVHAERVKKWKIIQSPFGSSYFMKKFHSPLRFLAPLVWESFDFGNYDLVISSSGWYISRGIITHPKTVHICYLHHPPRHLYGYETALEWQKYWPVRVYALLINCGLRLYDYLASQRVDYFIANSYETQKRIKKFYRCDSTVIYPPVEIRSLKAASQESKIKLNLEKYFLSVSRLARAKHIDLIIKSCQKLNQPLIVVGKGREERNLQSLVNNRLSKVTFLGEVKDEELSLIYQNARAFITASVDEEFGISAVEAMMYGKPVIAYRSGGFRETIVEDRNGLFFDQLTADSLTKTLQRFSSSNHFAGKDCVEDCLSYAQEFSKERFKKEIKEFVKRVCPKKK